MPFTLSHAAAALPFRRLRPVWPALVMGTFAPDLSYFIWVSDEDRSGHHFPDVLLVTLPLALVVLWIFEWIVKGPAFELLPRALQRRLQDKTAPLSFLPWSRFVAIVLWLTVGIATHLVWDSFTHSHTWMTAHWRVLTEPVMVPFLHPIALIKILQHLSSVGGLLIVAAWLGAWYLGTAPAPESAAREFPALVKGGLVGLMLIVASISGYCYARFMLAGHEGPISPLSFVATVFEAITLVLCIELVVYGLTFRAFHRASSVLTPQLNKNR